MAKHSQGDVLIQSTLVCKIPQECLLIRSQKICLSDRQNWGRRSAHNLPSNHKKSLIFSIWPNLQPKNRKQGKIVQSNFLPPPSPSAVLARLKDPLKRGRIQEEVSYFIMGYNCFTTDMHGESYKICCYGPDAETSALELESWLGNQEMADSLFGLSSKAAKGSFLMDYEITETSKDIFPLSPNLRNLSFQTCLNAFRERRLPPHLHYSIRARVAMSTVCQKPFQEWPSAQVRIKALPSLMKSGSSER